MAEATANLKNWASLYKTNPERIIRVLRLPNQNATTEDGDTAEDLRLILPVLLQLCDEGRQDADMKISKSWENYIALGVVDALCKLIIDDDQVSLRRCYPTPH